MAPPPRSQPPDRSIGYNNTAMSETARIARLLQQTFEGPAYYGPSVLGALAGVDAATAARKPASGGHGIWEIVAHLTAELDYARAVIDGSPSAWVEGETTWPAVTDTSAAAWQTALRALKQANRSLVRRIEQLDDDILTRQPPVVSGPFYVTLHGHIQHGIYHAGQIVLLKRQP